MKPGLPEIQAAARRIRKAVVMTPCPESIPLGELCGAHIHCKLDNMQRTGSFKERGARNALLCLSTEARKKGVIAASAGNHALGLAYHGGLLGIPVTVVMPRHAPLVKVATCERLGAKVLLRGEVFDEARALAMEMAEKQGLSYIHGFDDEAIIAGQGTLGLEILKQVPEVDAIVCAVGGGGLLAGIALAVKALKPEVEIIGVESRAMPGFHAAMEAGKPVLVRRKPTLADGLAVRSVGPRAFALAKDKVDRLVLVRESVIAQAILRMLELEKIVVEGAGATALAAMMSGQLDDLKGRRVVLVIGGGNIDPSVLGGVIERGLVHDGRLSRLVVPIHDRPGCLASLAKVIGEAGASIRDIHHDRAFSGPNLSAVNVECVVETRDEAHVRRLKRALRKAGFKAFSRG